MVSAVINMEKHFNKRVVAEGVETRERFDFLLSPHGDEGQGYYLNRPFAVDALTRLLRTGAAPTLPH